MIGLRTPQANGEPFHRFTDVTASMRRERVLVKLDDLVSPDARNANSFLATVGYQFVSGTCQSGVRSGSCG